MASDRGVRRASLICVFVFLAVPVLHAETKYFPDKGLDFDQRGHDMKVAWYSKQLSALREPSLFELSANREKHSYRFLWLRTFHHPIAIRLDFGRSGAGILTVKIADGKGGYEPGSLVENKSREVPREAVDWFLLLVKGADFWRLPMFDTPGCDGASWIVEGVEGGKYHIVDRWSPERGRSGRCAFGF